MIKNFFNLATTFAREKVLEISNVGYEAVNISRFTEKEVTIKKDELFISGQKYDLKKYRRIFLAAFGKGSSNFALSFSKILGSRLTGGIALDIKKPEISIWDTLPEEITFLVGTHPLPSLKNVEATRRIIKMADRLGRDDLIFFLITGGGSSLFCGSEEEMEEVVQITKLLTRGGAPIGELNTVRKHLSEVKGGNLAKIAYPAKVISLIVSDVCFEKEEEGIKMVASGPTVFDETNVSDARNVLIKYGINPEGFKLKETPKDKMIFEKTENIIFASNRDALVKMARKIEELEFKPKIFSASIKGEAKDVFKNMAEEIKKGEIIIAGGETTVTIKGKGGKGGRNQEAVLGGLSFFDFKEYFDESFILAALASDGRDNSEAAGAIGDWKIIEEAKRKKINYRKYLEEHNEFPFFEQTGGLVFADQESFNVADFLIIGRI
ncbi:MAG: DUF4147 domain-containing protein [Candidatus Pacebacteria bacterium]|nr:DUF4147 domain-containing protein [Candidatus Paceibacterota bacterium]